MCIRDRYIGDYDRYTGPNCHPADSAGSVMTPEFVSLRPGDTVRQALDTIRRTGIHKETVYTLSLIHIFPSQYWTHNLG